MRYFIKLTLVLLLAAGINACSDYLNPSTPQNKPIESIDGLKDLQSLITGTHSLMAQTGYYGRNVIINSAVRTDNAFSTGSSNRFLDKSMFDLLNTQRSLSGM